MLLSAKISFQCPDFFYFQCPDFYVTPVHTWLTKGTVPVLYNADLTKYVPIIYIVNKYMIVLFLRGMCGLSHLFYTVLISFRIRASYSMDGSNIAIHFILISKWVGAVYDL